MVKCIYKMFRKHGLSQYGASYLTVTAGIVLGSLAAGAVFLLLGSVFGFDGCIAVNAAALGAVLGCLASYIGLLNID